MRRRTMIVVLTLLGGCLTASYFVPWTRHNETAGAGEPRSRLSLEEIPFNGRRAYQYLQEICDLGPRISGSAGMEAQQKLVIKHFEQLGGQVALQRFRARHPQDGSPVSMANVLVHWHPESKERILLCAHYDTRPLPDQDPDRNLRQSGRFIGANDGASGVALLMEMAHHMADLKCRYGVDFVLFDGEELVYDGKRDPYFLGSEWFARQYVGQPPAHRYRWGVLLDMVGDANLQIYQEQNSVLWRDTRPLVRDIWKTAERLGVREFVARRKHTVNDDHLKLRNIAKIPTCDVIDFDYPVAGNRYWHTTADTPDKCSALSLAKVGWVIHQWLETVE